VKTSLLALVALCVVGFGELASAHTFQPFLLDVQEGAPGTFDVTWKVPTTSVDQNSPLTTPAIPVFPGHCVATSEAIPTRAERGIVHSWSMACGEAGLWGSRIRVTGLEQSPVDVLVRVSWLDSSEFVEMLRSDDPQLSLPAIEQTDQPFQVLGSYVGLGVEHILSGVDHLFFVLGLLMLVAGARRLFWTVTAFTLAHSLTLALSVLGYATLPSAPVEAVIAMSIVLVASEGLRRRATLSRRYPQVIGFLFGLVHGLGFAGALEEVGLPSEGVGTALFGFNLGVELGQLAFIAAVAFAAFCLKRTVSTANSRKIMSGAQLAAAYTIGSVACFWVCQRISAFL